MEVQFLVLPIPGPVNDIAVQLSQVNVEHRELGAYVLLSGDVTSRATFACSQPHAVSAHLILLLSG